MPILLQYMSSTDFKSTLFKQKSNVWSHSFIVPKNIASSYIQSGDKRVLCSLNGGKEFHCALMPFGNGDYFINVNKEIRNKHNIIEGDTLNVRLEKDTSEYGMPFPEEFAQALALDESGSHFFNKLTAGKQRNLIHLVGKVKSSEIRIKKSLVILQYLNEANGQLNFRELNEAFKLANRK